MKNPSINQSTSGKRLLQAAVIAGGAYLAFLMGKSLYERFLLQNTMNLADNSPEVRQAISLRTAMNPIGIEWLKWMDGTNNTIIDLVATEIIDLDKVLAAYRRMYQSELLIDLQGELSATEFRKFLETVAKNRQKSENSNQSSPAYTMPLNLIVAKQAVYVRTTPNASNHGAWYEMVSENNIAKTAYQGEFLGYATGKQQFDAKNNVKFIEVAYRNAATLENKTLWVSSSSSYIDQFSSIASMEAKYPSTKGVTAVLQPVYSPASLSFPGQRAFSKCPTELYDKGFQVVGKIERNKKVGKPIMRLKGRGMDYTLIKTTTGNEFWILSNHLIFQ